MSLLDELLKQAMQAKKTPVQNDVPGGLLAMLTQSNQAVPQSDMASMVMNRPMPQPATLPEMPQYQGGSGLGKGIINSLLGEWFDERKYTKDAERAEAEKVRQAEELKQIFSSGKQGNDLYYELAKARSPVANKIAEKGLEPQDPEKVKIVEVGVEGRPDLRQQARYDSTTQSLIPFGPYWKPSSGVQINTGDLSNMIKDTEAGNIVDAQGNAVKIPIGMTKQQAAEKGYSYGKPPTQAEVKSDVSFDTTTGLLNDIKAARKEGASVTGIGGVIQNFRSGNDPLGAVVNEALNRADIKIKPKNAELMSKVKNFGNYALQVMRGAQVGPAEQELFQKALPSEGQPDEVFDANMATAEKIFKDAMAKTQQSSSRTGSKTPSLDLPTPVPGTEMGGFIFIGGDPAKQENWRPK
jgi:hypothetical protein